MPRPQSHIRNLLYSALFIFLWIQRVLGDDHRLDVLLGNDGESSCTLKENIYLGCHLSPPLISNATFETPATCTCNKVFFNIWSACSYSTGENVFPIFKDWTSICASSGINLDQAEFLASKDTWGVKAPAWAKTDVPDLDTMDFQKAILTAQSGWNELQIILPIVTALVAFVVTILVMQLYHTRRERGSWRERVFRLIRPIPKVKNVNKYESWEIEANDGVQYELVSPPNASDAYAFGPGSAQQVHAQQPLHRGGHNRTESEALEADSDNGWSSLRNVRLPWQRSPKPFGDSHISTEFDADQHSGSSLTVGLTSDAGSMYSPRRPASNEGSGDQTELRPPVVGGDSYNDPFSEETLHR